MKNKILALLATIGMVSSVSAVEINDNISINGFIDGSWSNSDNDSALHDDTDIGLDEVELNFIVSAGNVDGEIHIDQTDAFGDNVNIEQAHFTYSFENGLSAQIGVFGSNLGYEREDPAGLYTYSRAYDDGVISNGGFNFGNVDESRLEGVRLSYSTETISVGVAAVNGVGVMEEEDTAAGFDEDNLDYEITISFNGIENLVVSAGLYSVNDQEQDLNDDGDTSDLFEPANDITAYGISAAYTLDKLLLACEYSNIDPDAAATNDLSAYMLLADYDVNEKLGIAVRYSEWETGPNAETDKLTIAPNYAITSSLGAILEYSSQDDNAGNDEDTLALELTFTF
jgi:predicted porin